MEFHTGTAPRSIYMGWEYLNSHALYAPESILQFNGVSYKVIPGPPIDMYIYGMFGILL